MQQITMMDGGLVDQENSIPIATALDRVAECHVFVSIFTPFQQETDYQQRHAYANDEAMVIAA